jgi:hypothetical protein
MKILEIFTKFNIIVQRFSIKDDTKSDRKIIKIVWEVNTPSQISMISKYIKNY